MYSDLYTRVLHQSGCEWERCALMLADINDGGQVSINLWPGQRSKQIQPPAAARFLIACFCLCEFIFGHSQLMSADIRPGDSIAKWFGYHQNTISAIIQSMFVCLLVQVSDGFYQDLNKHIPHQVWRIWRFSPAWAPGATHPITAIRQPGSSVPRSRLSSGDSRTMLPCTCMISCVKCGETL